MSRSAEEYLVLESTKLAAQWQKRANELLTQEEKFIQDQLKRLLTNTHDKVLLTKMIDQSFRSQDPKRIADQLSNLMKEEGVPEFLGRVEKLFVQMFMGFGKHFSSIAVPTKIGRAHV